MVFKNHFLFRITLSPLFNHVCAKRIMVALNASFLPNYNMPKLIGIEKFYFTLIVNQANKYWYNEKLIP